MTHSNHNQLTNFNSKRMNFENYFVFGSIIEYVWQFLNNEFERTRLWTIHTNEFEKIKTFRLSKNSNRNSDFAANSMTLDESNAVPFGTVCCVICLFFFYYTFSNTLWSLRISTIYYYLLEMRNDIRCCGLNHL